jgi:hypothetical protein
MRKGVRRGHRLVEAKSAGINRQTKDELPVSSSGGSRRPSGCVGIGSGVTLAGNRWWQMAGDQAILMHMVGVGRARRGTLLVFPDWLVVRPLGLIPDIGCSIRRSSGFRHDLRCRTAL